MNTEQQVTYRVVNGVAWLTINRPEARNALNAAVRQGLFDGFARFNDDVDARVLHDRQCSAPCTTRRGAPSPALLPIGRLWS